MKVLVTGDRNWTDRESIRSWLSKLQDQGYDTLIEGEARGADTIARQEAESMGYTIERYPAQWTSYGKAAGVKRNQQMIDEGKPDLVLWFHHDLKNSKGTRDMVNRAISQKIPVIAGVI